MIIASFVAFLLFFTLVGLASIIKSKNTTNDYLVAGNSVKPWLVGISAVATNNSGFMFIAMIGYTYASGLSSIWVILPWIFGDFLASLFIHKRLRVATGKRHITTFSGLLSDWSGRDYTMVRKISAVIIILFLGTYAAAQLSAGSKALHVLFGWNYSIGAIIGSVIVLAYCFAGGIRASIWTDAAQSFVMIAAMALLAFTAINHVGGLNEFITKLNNISPTYMNWFPEDLLWGPFIGAMLLITSWTVAGIGVIGQPHIMIRFMAMDRPQDMKAVRFYYYGWYLLFTIFTLTAGFAARILLPEATEGISFDSELALPNLAQMLLPEILIGMILAGLFAATMSTADSQILSCSAALTQDLEFGKDNYILTKIGTIFVTVTALTIALYGDDNVFSLVKLAWSALGSAFSPLLLVYALGGKPTEKTATLMMIIGLISMLLWKYLGYSAALYEIFPGIVAGLITYKISFLKNKMAVKNPV
ncbi:MAG: sodium/proline symporter [Rickettsiales bacterium]